MIILFRPAAGGSTGSGRRSSCARTAETPAAQAVTRVPWYFTLFFIPVVPLGGKYVVTCTMWPGGRPRFAASRPPRAYVASAQPPRRQGAGTPAPLGQPAHGGRGRARHRGAEPGRSSPTGGT